jgi:hypothetical protein
LAKKGFALKDKKFWGKVNNTALKGFLSGKEK